MLQGLCVCVCTRMLFGMHILGVFTKIHFIAHIKDAVKAEWNRHQQQEQMNDKVVLDLKRQIGVLTNKLAVSNKLLKDKQLHIQKVQNWPKTSFVKTALGQMSATAKKKLFETFPKYAPHKYGGPPAIAKQFSPKTTHVISDDDDDDQVIKKKHTTKHKTKKYTPKTPKTVEQKKNEIESESDDDEDVGPGMYVVKCLHERSVYKPRKNGLRSRVGGYSYLVEYDGYPDPKDFSWQYDYELRCAKLIAEFNDQDPSKGDVQVAASRMECDGDVRQKWVDEQLVEYMHIHNCLARDVPSSVLTNWWDASYAHCRK